MTNLLQFIKSYDDLRKDGAENGNRAAGASATKETAPAASQPPAADGGRADSPAPVLPPSPSRVDPVAPGNAAAATPSNDDAAAALYQRAIDGVSRLFEAAVMEKLTPGRLHATIVDLEEMAPEVVHSTSSDRNLLRKAMGTYTEGEGFILPHSVNVGILAVHLGREIELAASVLPQLCFAGFVHDVGSVQLPAGLLTKADSLTPAEWDMVRSRPSRSYEILRALGPGYERVAQVAHQVHERLDGSGYPHGLQGDEILPEARILGTVDFFESFAHPRPYKGTVPTSANHGIQMLMQMADKFGPATLKALVSSVGLFPIGSYVRLSGGEVGRVVDVKSENPMRPQVEILLTNERRPPREPRTLDLLSIPHIYVSRALTASDLRELGLLPRPTEIRALNDAEEARS